MTNVVIGILQVQINLPGISSLKSKRSLLKRIMHSVQEDFNVSTCELGQQDQWQSSLLGFARIGTDRDVVHATLSRLADEFRTSRQVDLVDQQIELL